MPGDATLGTDLVDEMQVVADEIRADLYPDTGVRSFRVFTVLRTWSSGYIGDGDFDDVETEITPRPYVKPFTGYNFDMEPCGLDEAGSISMTEISLTYTQAQLDGGDLENGIEFLYILREGQSQEQRDTTWLLAKPPYPDRAVTPEGPGWIVSLRRVSD